MKLRSRPLLPFPGDGLSAFSCTVLLVFLLLSAATTAGADDWPQYRGPDRHGTTAEASLLESWSGAQPEVVWRRELGDGFSAVSAADGRLFTAALVETDQGTREALLALDAETGEEIWRVLLGEPVETEFGNGPRSTPTIAGDRVYMVSSRSLLLALGTSDGRELWRQDLAGDQPVPRFGYSMSPLVDSGQVIVEAGSEEPGRSVAAFDAATGKERWRALDGAAGYSSPIAVEIEGVRQYVFSRREGPEVVALSTSGEVLWRHGISAVAVIPMPIFLPPNHLFVSSSDDDFGGLMLQIERSDDTFQTAEVWQERLMRNHFNSSVVVGGFLYGFDNATFKCLSAADGSMRWARRGFGKGSLIAAGDLLFVLADNGTLALVRATPEAYRELGRSRPMSGKAWTAPSLADGRLYLRDQDEMVALGIGGPRATPPDAKTQEILAAYAQARGGAERWRAVRSLRLAGTYAAFSETSAFTTLRQRPHLHRLDFELLGTPATRARDAEGPWLLHKLLSPQPALVAEEPYKSQLERESLFPLFLLDETIAMVALTGEGEIDGQPTLELQVTIAPPGTTWSSEETWHLDPQTFLEVAVDSQIIDLTQGPEPKRQRAFYSDFREVEGLVLPFLVEWEFGARLESMTVDEVAIDPELDADTFTRPPGEPAEDTASEG